MVEVVALKAPSVASPSQELPSIRPALRASAPADPSGSPQDTSQWMTVTEDALYGPPPRHHNFAFVWTASRVCTVPRCCWPQWKEWGTQQRGGDLDLPERGERYLARSQAAVGPWGGTVTD